MNYNEYLISCYGRKSKDIMSEEEFAIEQYLNDALNDSNIELEVEFNLDAEEFPVKSQRAASRRKAEKHKETQRMNELLDSNVFTIKFAKDGIKVPATEHIPSKELAKYKKGNNEYIRKTMNYGSHTFSEFTNGELRAKQDQELLKLLNEYLNPETDNDRMNQINTKEIYSKAEEIMNQKKAYERNLEKMLFSAVNDLKGSLGTYPIHDVLERIDELNDELVEYRNSYIR